MHQTRSRLIISATTSSNTSGPDGPRTRSTTVVLPTCCCTPRIITDPAFIQRITYRSPSVMMAPPATTTRRCAREPGLSRHSWPDSGGITIRCGPLMFSPIHSGSPTRSPKSSNCRHRPVLLSPKLMTMTTKDSNDPEQPKPKRRRRRVTVAGTGPASADGPEPRLEDLKPKTDTPRNKLSERDRWMLEEKPPHY